MEATATAFLSSAPRLMVSTTSIPPLLFPQNLNHRSLIFCSRASLRGNLEVTGVPTSVPVRVAHELLLAGHHYLDIRTPEEFSEEHADGAINIPYMYRVGSGMTKNLKFVEEVSSHFRKHDEIIVGGKSGKSSIIAATDLLAVGFTAITDIAGGYDAWTHNGLPTE
ncbi:thiosulfate sulfurtransferase 16, chloroplastic-like isoform X2 [Tripterygium wilfordii]|uniref:thiosulfate sulfurtransferase 16, chloroplastic-like isoform X2 n=1 Tax=Tripterygium wilfordii TaxID=458696 RepID=UPI0018F82F0F|nr:thiosulfate sulfurtransferase 16, chloroplastic-like isoform X2 [Tripterygium wilfordii]